MTKKGTGLIGQYNLPIYTKIQARETGVYTLSHFYPLAFRKSFLVPWSAPNKQYKREESKNHGSRLRKFKEEWWYI